MPETLMNAVIELEQAYDRYKDDPGFKQELDTLLTEYANRPSRLYFAEKMTKDLGGAKIYLKREDLQTVRSYKIRGAYNKIRSLSPDVLKYGIVCASAGNHAQGVAFSCNKLQIMGSI